MNKKEALEWLSKTKDDLKNGDNFKGKAALVRKIDSKIRFLTGYKLEDKNCLLLINETKKELGIK